VTNHPMRMPPLPREAMSEAQRAAADELIAGPRKGVKGPFIALMRSPELMARLQKVGEYLRFQSSVPQRLNEFATLIVARDWHQQFEWFVHAPAALREGVAAETLDALREGRRPPTMAADEALVYELVTELCARRGISDATYADALNTLGEQGVIDLVSLVGYFTSISMVLNVARIPEEPNPAVVPLPALPA
jgi:4-carboxymuconolactone decarboxylase